MCIVLKVMAERAVAGTLSDKEIKEFAKLMLDEMNKEHFVLYTLDATVELFGPFNKEYADKVAAWLLDCEPKAKCLITTSSHIEYDLVV